MTIKELVMEISNKPGELAGIISRLYENDVNVRAFWIGHATKKGTLRFIASDPEAALSVLTGLEFKVVARDVLAVQVPDHPGGFNTLLKILEAGKINILHVYPCMHTEDTVLILDVDKMEEAIRVFRENWIHLYDDTLYKL